jgi:KUP system potassium uptake protein
MWIWHRGVSAVHACIQETSTPLEPLLQALQSGAVPRVPGSAVFFTRSAQGAPPVLNWHLKHNRVLHESLLLIRLSFALTARVAREDRLTLTQMAPNFWRADVSYGFMETADIPQLLEDAKVMGCNINLDDVTYYVGHDTIVSRADGRGLPIWQTAIFALLFRNAARLSEFLKIPSDQLVEIGRQVPI